MESILSNYLGILFEMPIVHVAKVEISISTIFYFVFVIVAAYLSYLVAKLFINVQIKKGKIRTAQGKSLLQLFGYLVFIVAILFVIRGFGYSLSYFFVGSTALLVGLGFGLQQLFLDVISGIILLVDKYVNLGDVVRLDTSSGRENMHGRIQRIGLRATLLQTTDNEFMVIPNSKFLSSGISSFMKERGSARFRISILVEYGQDMEQVKKVLSDAVLSDVNVDKNPNPTVIAKDFAESGILLEVRFWTKELFNSENVLSEIRFKILENFRANNIKIPFPQVVYHKAEPGSILSHKK